MAKQKTYSVIKGHKVLIKMKDGSISELRYSEKPTTKTTKEDLYNLGIDVKIIPNRLIK